MSGGGIAGIGAWGIMGAASGLGGGCWGWSTSGSSQALSGPPSSSESTKSALKRDECNEKTYIMRIMRVMDVIYVMSNMSIMSIMSIMSNSYFYARPPKKPHFWYYYVWLPLRVLWPVRDPDIIDIIMRVYAGFQGYVYNYACGPPTCAWSWMTSAQQSSWYVRSSAGD